MPWSRSDAIALVAMVMAGGALYLQYRDRGMPYKVQAYIDKTQAANKIIDSVEQVIHARQLAMISVEYNIYEPVWAKRMSLQDMNSDAKEATPVVIALGNYKGTLQNNLRFFNKPDTVAALDKLDKEVDLAVKCFTDVASARHRFGAEQLQRFRDLIATSCAGANIENSLDALKDAERTAMIAMDAERAAGGDKNVPKPD